MSELVLVRHGQASFGAEDYDRLSALGHEQADWLGAYFAEAGLSFDHMARGDLRRHRETAEGILRHAVAPDPVVDARLDEFHYWPLEQDYIRHTGSGAPARNRDDFLQLFPRIFAAWEEGRIGGGGESFADFDARVSAALEAHHRRGGRSLIVTSGGVIGVALRRVLGLSAASAAELLINIHNASLHRLVWEGGKWRLSLFNASPHLDADARAHARTFV